MLRRAWKVVSVTVTVCRVDRRSPEWWTGYKVVVLVPLLANDIPYYYYWAGVDQVVPVPLVGPGTFRKFRGIPPQADDRRFPTAGRPSKYWPGNSEFGIPTNADTFPSDSTGSSKWSRK
eukprot:611404-Rhodomonas_salina.3